MSFSPSRRFKLSRRTGFAAVAFAFFFFVGAGLLCSAGIVMTAIATDSASIEAFMLRDLIQVLVARREDREEAQEEARRELSMIYVKIELQLLEPRSDQRCMEYRTQPVAQRKSQTSKATDNLRSAHIKEVAISKFAIDAASASPCPAAMNPTMHEKK